MKNSENKGLIYILSSERAFYIFSMFPAYILGVEITNSGNKEAFYQISKRAVRFVKAEM